MKPSTEFYARRLHTDNTHINMAIDKVTTQNWLIIGENEQLEFKRSTNSLPSSLWETYSAFANTNGGVIVLGLTENIAGANLVSGVSNPEKLIKELWNTINNTQKVNVNILNNKHISTLFVDNKQLICIEVPYANRQERPIFINKNIMTGAFRRNADGDYWCSSDEVKAMIRDQSDSSADTVTYPDINADALLSETLRRYRIRFKNLKSEHIWNNLDDDDFLLKIGATRRHDNQIVPTLAGIVLFADDSVITTILPDYFLDFRETKLNENDRWVDRIYSSSGNWTGNVFDFYFSVIDKVTLDTKLPFKLEATSRIDSTPVHEALREAVANAVIHADYHGKQGIVIEKSFQFLQVSNPGSFRIPLTVVTDGGISDPRNATIFKIRSLVGIGERAGSGLYSIQHEWNKHQWPSPTITQSFNPERVRLILTWLTDFEGSEKTAESSEKTNGSSEKTADKILHLLKQNSKLTSLELSIGIGVSSRAIEKQIKQLKLSGLIRRIGPDKGGCWEIINNEIIKR